MVAMRAAAPHPNIPALASFELLSALTMVN
jgi:hypothetical protein